MKHHIAQIKKNIGMLTEMSENLNFELKKLLCPLRRGHVWYQTFNIYFRDREPEFQTIDKGKQKLTNEGDENEGKERQAISNQIWK